MVSLALKYAHRAVNGVARYICACPFFLLVLVVTFAMNLPIVVWAVWTLCVGLGCRNTWWLVVGGVFAMCHVTGMCLLAYKLDVSYEAEDRIKTFIADRFEAKRSVGTTDVTTADEETAQSSPTQVTVAAQAQDYVHMEKEQPPFTNTQTR
ncbi:hypothetical protein MPSEU_000061200 [Mayamaea pseudoterrestris]|nr:hypothetical protein MPSEU_000061200 [Mayamaea pseudoterrestris]